MSDTTRDAREEGNDPTRSRLEAAHTPWDIIYLALFTGVWALGWAVFSCILYVQTFQAACLAALAMYLLVMALQFLGLFAGWKKDPNILVVYRRCCVPALLCLLSCRAILCISASHLQGGCQGISPPLPALCKLAEGGLLVPMQVVALTLEFFFYVISITIVFGSHRRPLDQASTADDLRSQNQYQLQSFPRQQTGSASRDRDEPAPPYDGNNLPTYSGGLPEAGDTKDDPRSSEIGDEDLFVGHGSKAGRSDSGHGEPRE